MARDNLTWGQRRITNALRLKLGLRVSPRPVRKSMPTRLLPGPGQRVPSQRWRTFVRNHARALIVRDMAADLLTRGVRAMSARIRRCLHQQWGRTVAHGVPGSALRDTVPLAVLIDMRSVPRVWRQAIGSWQPTSSPGRAMIEATFSQDKQALGIVKRRQHTWEAQQIVLPLARLAHHLLLWSNAGCVGCPPRGGA